MVIDDGIGDDRIESPVLRLHIRGQRVRRPRTRGIRANARSLRPQLRDGFVKPALIAPGLKQP